MTRPDEPSSQGNVVPFPRSRSLERSERQRSRACDEGQLIASLLSDLDSVEDELDIADREAIEVEAKFIHRFGFDAPRYQRARILELKYESDLTDSEIRSLRWSRSLVVTMSGAKICAPTWLAVSGWMHISCIFLIMLGVLSNSGLEEYLTGTQLLKLLLVEAVLLTLVVAFHRMYVYPNTLLRRVNELRRHYSKRH